MNKYGGFNPMFIIIGFMIIAATFLFSTRFIYEAGDEFLLEPIVNTTQEVTNDLGVPESQNTAINSIKSNYDNLGIPYDLFFLGLWVFAIVISISEAIMSRKSGVFSFIGMLFIGTMIFLLISSFFGQFTEWFITQVYDTLFSDSIISTPIIDWYLGNMQYINFVWWLLLLLINRLDTNTFSREGRVEA